jgi:hypothetical protein
VNLASQSDTINNRRPCRCTISCIYMTNSWDAVVVVPTGTKCTIDVRQQITTQR